MDLAKGNMLGVLRFSWLLVPILWLGILPQLAVGESINLVEQIVQDLSKDDLPGIKKIQTA